MDASQFARAVAEGAVERAQAAIGQQQWAPATVVSFVDQTRDARLVLDEDLSGGSPVTAATSLVGDLLVGQRVMVARIQPFGLVVVGSITGDPNPWQTSSAMKALHGGYTAPGLSLFWVVNLGSTQYDYTSGAFTPGANHKYVCQTTGLYGFDVNVGYFPNGIPHVVYAAIFQNGAEPLGARSQTVSWGSQEVRIAFSTQLACSRGDVMDLRHYSSPNFLMTNGYFAVRRVA